MVRADLFHFVSYVPVDGGVYELDGLQPGPVKIGEGDEVRSSNFYRRHLCLFCQPWQQTPRFSAVSDGAWPRNGAAL